MSKYKGIIFDLDGTLLDTIADLSDAVNEVMKFYHYPLHDQTEYKKRIGHGFRNLIEVSIPPEELHRTDLEEALDIFLQAYDQCYANRTHPYPGIEDLLSELKKRDILIGVNSNKRNDYTNRLIQLNFPDTAFVEILGELKGIPKKPDPWAAFRIATKMNLDPADILYVGDSPTDIKTGKAAGMGTAAVSWGFKKIEELIKNDPDMIIRDPMEILENVITKQ